MSHIDVYGVNHSPWVQAVLLGLHEKGVDHSLKIVPPFQVLLTTGVMMPAASIDGEPWQLESAEILRRVGFDDISPSDMRAIQAAWQGVLHRPDSAFRFWHAFSLHRDSDTPLWRRLRNQFLRSFMTLYFFLLIRAFVFSGKGQDPENFTDQFIVWEEKLEHGEGPFLGGNVPCVLDLMLFGIIQCHCSIPVPPLEVLRHDPRLSRTRSWISAMNARFADYEHLYSGVYFEPHSPAPERAPALERAAYWLGAATMVVSFPVTIPLVLFLAMRVRRT